MRPQVHPIKNHSILPRMHETGLSPSRVGIKVCFSSRYFCIDAVDFLYECLKILIAIKNERFDLLPVFSRAKKTWKIIFLYAMQLKYARPMTSALKESLVELWK